MKHTTQKSPADMESLLEKYGDMLYRLCLIMLKHESDAEDAVQETVIRYCFKAPDFAGPEHEKAWLIRVATNKCRDLLRLRTRHTQLIRDVPAAAETGLEETGILDALTSLPEKYRLVMTLHYIEEYSIADIAGIIRRTPSAVKMRLQKGRAMLKSAYGKEH